MGRISYTGAQRSSKEICVIVSKMCKMPGFYLKTGQNCKKKLFGLRIHNN